MIVERLKALWNLPTLLHNEAHHLQSAIDRVTEAARMALSRQPPAFVLVLLQGQHTGGEPFVAAMSGELHGTGGALRLRYDVTGAIAQLTVLVFCDLQRVRILGMRAGNYPLSIQAAPNQTCAPMAHHARQLLTGTAVVVELVAR